MTFKMPRNLMAAVSVVAFAALLSSCGGGGGGSSPVATMDDDTTMTPDDTTMAGPMIAGETVPSGTVVMLPAGTAPQDVTIRAAMGETVTFAGIAGTCASADGCSVDVKDDVVTTTGDIVVVALAIEDPALLASVLTQLAAAITPPVVPEPTEHEQAQIDAAAAAATAKTASEDAATASTAAAEAVANHATVQTGATSAALAKEAADYAAKAMAAYADAKKASEDAAAAEDVTAAVEARLLAELATVDAVSYSMTAVEKGTAAETAANAELMIDGTVKSVGDITVNAAAAASTVASGAGANLKTAVTGLIKGVGPTTPGPETLGRAAVPEIPDNTETEYMSPLADAAMRPLTIGKTVDSDDDAARLRIVTKFASTLSVKVFARAVGADGGNEPTLTANKPGVITLDVVLVVDEEAVEVDRPLKSLGLYYQVGDSNQLVPGTDTIGATTTPVHVYSYKNAEDVTVYAVLHGRDTVGATTTYSYATANIFVLHNPDGESPQAMTQVTALLPVARDYSHIHFGVWASLGDASSTGSQNLADLGIGFVQSIGDGLTADMPNNGTGTFAGNWVASVQGSHPTGEGDIRELSGTASLTANFRKGEVNGILSDLATFKADIEDASFATDAVKVTAADLDADDKWTGGLSGAFYGDQAIEAGGVFNFATNDNKGGAFTGAFGTNRTDKP